MAEETINKTCVIVGASQAGVSCAFALREEGWGGDIILYDADPMLPYYRPPLSKAALTGAEDMEEHVLKPAHLYEKENISLKLGTRITSIDSEEKYITLQDGSKQTYDKIVFATGARPFIPKIDGIDKAKDVFTVRTAADAAEIRKALESSVEKRAVIIGGGYIGLETAASLKKLGAKVTVLERENRVLARVTAPEMSNFFQRLHAENGVDVLTGKNVVSFRSVNGHNQIECSDGERFDADVVIVGVGIQVNKELAEQAGLKIENGILVDETTRTSNEDIHAIGDCTFHHNPYYDRFVRLESVQNASDQAKIAAAAICGKESIYKALPWFWSDQYDVKLQMVGLSEGYTETVVRKEEDNRFSVWYFNEDKLLAVDAVNHTKAYVMGTKFIKAGNKVDKLKIADTSEEFKPANVVVE